MPDLPPIQFVREAKIDDAVADKTAVITFANQQEEDRYVALDTQLIESIKRVFDSFGIRRRGSPY